REFWASESPHLLRVKRAEIDGFADIAVGFRPRLADFENFYCRKFIETALENLSCTLQQPRSLLDRRPSPFFECRARSFNRTLGFVDASLGSLAHNLGRLGWINRRR